MTKKEHFLRISLRESNNKLAAKERRFAALIEKSNEMTMLLSPEGKFLYVSPAVTQTLGYSLEEILSLELFRFLHPEDIQKRTETQKKTERNPGKTFFCQHRIRHKNGTWIWCEGTITNMLHEPAIGAFVCHFQNITEKKLAEEKLEQSEKRFRNFFENAPEGITILDAASLKFISCNFNALRLLKFSQKKLLEKTPADISPEFQPDGRRSDEKAAELILKAINGEKLTFEWLIKTGNDKRKTVEVRLMLLSGGSNPQLYASFVDISQRKEIERTLVSQNKKLSEIAIFQSHQVRKPIASILGLASLFNYSAPNDPQNAEVMSKIVAVTKMFDGIIKEIVLRTTESYLNEKS